MGSWKSKTLLISVFLLSMILYFSIPKQASKIRLIPQEDRWILEGFFRALILQEGGAFTLFGDKPITYDAYFESQKDEVPNLLTAGRCWQGNEHCKAGWQVWEKYRHLFPSKDFLLLAKHRNENWIEIILLNKALLTQKMQEHLCEFKSILGQGFTPESFLSQYEKSDDSLFHLLKEHHGLFGILLGFGKRNAWMYQERDRICVDDFRFTLKTHPLPCGGFETIAEEKDFFACTFARSFNDMGRLTFINLPYFMVDPKSKETCSLQKKYLLQRKHIQDIYDHGNFLEITLAKFCSD